MTDELSRYLQSIEREDDYRVDCVLKQSDSETTERVFARSADGGEHGPYIRKRIARDSGMGDIYERIYRANKAGKRFAHIPYVLDFYRTEQATVVVMEHVNGQTLADVVYERDPGVQLSVELFPAICDEFLPRLITTDSEEFRSLNLPFKVLETPGHTADHISLLISDKLFCGDAAMNNFPSQKRVIIWIENLQQFKQSWQAILAAAPKTIYPAHGKPFPASDLQKFLPDLDKIRLYPIRH